MCESLRQKNSCLTQLWRVALLLTVEATKGESRLIGKLSGEGQRPSYVHREDSVLFCFMQIFMVFDYINYF